MTRWPTMKLCEIATVQMGQSPPGKTYNSVGIGLPFFQGKAEFGEEYPTRVKWCNQPSRIAEAGDILLSVRAPVGPTNFAAERCCIGRGLASIRGESNKCNQRYIRYYLKRFEADISARGVGSTFTAINRDDLERLELPVPPLAEQKRIVKLLDEADELRKLRAQADRRTADLIPALFHDMFGDRRDFPVSLVEELAEQRDGSIRTGPFGSDLRHSEFVDEGIPVLGIDNVVENEFRWTKPRCITRLKFGEMRRFIVFPSDVLVTIMGTVGRCVVAPDNLPTCVSTKHLCTVTVNRDRIEPRYLWASLLFDESVRRQTRIVGKGAIMEGWNSTIIKRLTIRVPPLPLQKDFAARVAEIRAMEAQQAVSRRRLDDLFHSLLHRAFNGEL